LAVVRGALDGEGRIELPLPLDSTGIEVPARTSYQVLGRVEAPSPAGSPHPTARFSLLRVRPETGRYHQIRRHFARISHPLIGDAQHGDSRQNRFFRETFGLAGLCLKAQTLRLTPPWRPSPLEFSAPPCARWRRIEELFHRPAY
jgi:tRNA pseudouridine65 synthase